VTDSKDFKFLYSMAEVSECWCWIRWDTHDSLAKNLKQAHNLISVKGETLLIKANDASSTGGKTNSGTPWVVSIASVVIFLLGFALTVAVIIEGVAMMYIPLPSMYVIAILLGLVLAPLLTLSGYNLWKMKKWAAQLAATIILLDLMSTLFIHSSAPFLDILASIADIIILVLIAISWEHLDG